MTFLPTRAADPVDVFDAIGIGWGVYELYPNPTNQQAFLSAVERLSVLHDSSITFEIGAASVSCVGEELPIARGGTERLSLRLFVHEIEWLEIVSVPTVQEMKDFYDLLAVDEAEARQDGGISAALDAHGVGSILVTQRGLLSEVLDTPWEEREGEHETGSDGTGAVRLAHMITAGASPTDVAESMVGEAGGDTKEMADSFCEAFRMIYGEVDSAATEYDSIPEALNAYRHAPRTRPPVDTFAETFFLLPVEAQSQVLSDFLSNRQQGLHSLLLDQFGGAELAELSPHLDEETFEELVAYARDVVDSATGTADELLPMVSAARDVKLARQSAAARIREMIEGIGGLGGATGGLAGRLRKEIAATDELGRRLVRLLFDIEDRPDRFARLVDSWCSRISGEVRAGKLDEAIVLLHIATETAELSPSKRRTVDEGLVELLRSDYAVFNDAGREPEHREALGVLLEGFGEPAADHLMQRLSVEEDPATRRVLIDLLVIVGSSHPDPIARFFTAAEWYVVRNAVAIAGRIGGEQWVPRLRPLVDHSDHRVVIETLRALTPIAPDEAIGDLVDGLAHENPRVRESALLLLRASESAAREAALIEALTDRSMDLARQEIAELLHELGTPDAVSTLAGIAKKPFLVSATRRDARRAARVVLGRAA